MKSRELDLRLEEAGRFLQRCARLDATCGVRSGAAFFLFLSVLAMKLKKKSRQKIGRLVSVLFVPYFLTKP
jgi:hypothetical protein